MRLKPGSNRPKRSKIWGLDIEPPEIVKRDYLDRMRQILPGLTENRGFTLVEIIAVLVILSVLAAVAVPRFIDVDANARIRGLEYGIAEMNGRESLTWANVKLSDSGWENDAQVWNLIDTHLGNEYSWNVPPTATGGSLEFRQEVQPVVRNRSTFTNPALWNR